MPEYARVCQSIPEYVVRGLGLGAVPVGSCVDSVAGGRLGILIFFDEPLQKQHRNIGNLNLKQ